MCDDAGKLRRQLQQLRDDLDRLLAPALEPDPILPGAIHVSTHRCGKATCHCRNGGKLHEARRLQIRFADGIANRRFLPEEAAFWRQRTEAYKRTREAGRAFRRWEKEVRRVLDALERARTSSEGLSEKDRRRPLR